MKRAALLLLVLAALLAPAGVRAQAITAGFGGNVSSLVNVPFDVPFILDMTARPERLGAFAARIQWNPAVLQYQTGVNGNFGAITTNSDSVAQGVLRLTGANPAGAAGLVTLSIGRFLPLAADTMTMVLSLPELYAAGSFADLRSSVTVTNGRFCPAVGRFGDVDGDGKVDSRDALIALMAAVGLDVSQYPIALGDVDGNGVVDTRDALIILSNAVGIDVSAFRVGVIMGGACANVVPVTLAITPSAVAGVLPGQQVSFEVRAAGPTGSLVIIPNPVLKSSDTTVLTFHGGANPATAVAVAPGTATVTAIRDTRDSVKTTVTVVGRRYSHFVDAKAATAANQLGTAAFPFATIAQAVLVARGGDTIRPQPGRYLEEVRLDSAVVLLGDTLPDGTRPVVAPAADSSGTGISLRGAAPREVHNVAVEGYNVAFEVLGPASALLRRVRTTSVTTGVLVDSGPVGSLRIESSRLAGRGSYVYGGDGVSATARLDTLVIRGSEISDFGYDGVYTSNADSLRVVGSRIHDVGDYALDANMTGAPGLALAVDSSMLVASSYYTAYVSDPRTVAFAHNHIVQSNPYYYYSGVEVYGSGHGWVRFRGDSIDQAGTGGADWIYATALDSVVVDSAWVRAPGSGTGYAYNVSLVRVTNSRFTNVSGTALDVTFSSATLGGSVVVDNVIVSGDPKCDLCGTGFSVYNTSAAFSRLTMSNLAYGIYATGDSSVTVTTSRFQHGSYPVYWSPAAAGPTLSVTNTAFQGMYTGVLASGGAATVSGNSFNGANNYAIEVTNPQGPVQIAHDTVSNAYHGIYVYPYAAKVTATVSDNVVTGVPGYGIYGYGGGADSLNVTFQILRNAVSCTNNGYGIIADYAHTVIKANQIQGCQQGIATYANSGATAVPRLDSILANSITLPASSTGGIQVFYAVRARISGNTVTADTAGYSSYGDIYVQGDSTVGGPVTARIDSNTVSGGVYQGIYATGLDSVVILSNSVQGVKTTCFDCVGYGGIVVTGPTRGTALIKDNLVRGVNGNGIVASNADTGKAAVVVDSNLVSGDSVGIVVGQPYYPLSGPVHVTHNRVTGSGRHGLYFYDADTSRTLVDSNNIAGNHFGAVVYSYSYHAPNNWWGDSLGPRCVTGCASAVGDSVTSPPAVLFAPPLKTPMPLAGLPLTAPPVAMGSPAFSRAFAAAPAGGGIARGVSAPAVHPVPGSGSAPRRSAVRQPSVMKGLVAESWRLRLDARAATETRAARAAEAAATARAAREAEREARLRALQEENARAAAAHEARQRDAEAARQAHQARQAERP